MRRSPFRRRRRKPSPPATPPFAKDAEVEVRVDDDGFHGSWFEATVVAYLPARGPRSPARYEVAYTNLLPDTDGEASLVETVLASHLRPRAPPPPTPPPAFSLHDIVEAFHHDGWWSGIVVSTDASAPSVTVAFPITREVIAFQPQLVRPRFDFVDGAWVPSQTVIAVRPSYSVRIYAVGEKVEVVRNRAVFGYSWFPATVTKAIDKMSYIVEYYDLEEEDGRKVTEYLHWRFIRPAVEHCPLKDEFQLGLAAQVEVYCDGAWSLGVVGKVMGEGQYEVSVDGTENDLVVNEVAGALKPQYKWNGRNWSIVNSKRQASLKRQSVSGKRSSSPVDVATSDDEYKHDPESHAKTRSRKALQPQQDINLTEGLEHNSQSEMNAPLSTLRKLPSENSPLQSCCPLSEKNCPEVLLERILTTTTAPAVGLLDHSLQQPTPQKESGTNSMRKLSIVNQEKESNVMLSGGQSNTPGHEISTCEAHEMFAIVEQEKRKVASSHATNAAQQKEERLLPVKVLKGKRGIVQRKGKTLHPIKTLKKDSSNSVQTQLKKGTSSVASKEIVCALSAFIKRNTFLAVEKQKEAADVAPIKVGTMEHSRSNIEVLPILGTLRKSAKPKDFKKSHGPVHSSDYEASNNDKVTACCRTSTPQQKERKKAPGGLKEAPVKKKRKSSTWQHLDKTLENSLNLIEVPNQELPELPPVPLGFTPLCNEKDVGRATSTTGANVQTSHEGSAESISEVDRQAGLSEDEPTHMINGASQVNQKFDTSKDNVIAKVTETTGMLAETTDILYSGCPVQLDGGKAKEMPTLTPPRNAESTECTISDMLLRKCSVAESLIVPPLPLCQLSGKQLSFLKSSPIWPLIEAMDVFRKVPQQPHFLPLLQFSPALREGMALGLMVTFASLVESIGKLNIEDNTALFEEKVSTLSLLEENGFNVQILQSRMRNLLQIKSDQNMYKRDKEKLSAEILEKKADAFVMDTVIDAKHKAISDLEQKLELLRREEESLAKRKECEDAALLRLKAQEIEAQEACGNAERQFDRILAEPW